MHADVGRPGCFTWYITATLHYCTCWLKLLSFIDYPELSLVADWLLLNFSINWPRIHLAKYQLTLCSKTIHFSNILDSEGENLCKLGQREVDGGEHWLLPPSLPCDWLNIKTCWPVLCPSLVFARSPAKGAVTSLNCAVNPELNTQECHFYSNCRVTPPPAQALWVCMW